MAAKKAPAKRAPAKKPTPKAGPGVGGGKRGQALKASAAAYVSPNIGGVQPTGDLYGAYDSGDSMMQTKRNEWLNTLDVATRARAINQMGYWTGGVPTKTPKVSDKTLAAYGKGNTYAGTYQYESSPGVVSGEVTVDANGNVTSTNAFRKTRAQKGLPKVGPKGKGKGKTKTKPKGNGGGSGGYVPGGGLQSEADAAEASAAAFIPYAEGDTSTTSYKRAQGKAYGRGQGSYRAGGTSEPGSDSSVVEEAAAGGGGKRKKRPARKLTRKAKTKSSPGGTKVTARERKRIQAKKGK